MDHETLNGIDLYYTVQGPNMGTAVLLLHGFPDSSALWGHQLPALAAAGFRVIAPDLRGFGRSARPEGVAQYKLEHAQADVVALLKHLHVDRSAWFSVLTLPVRSTGDCIVSGRGRA